VESTVFGGGTMAMMAALASLFLLVTLASSGEIRDPRSAPATHHIPAPKL